MAASDIPSFPFEIQFSLVGTSDISTFKIAAPSAKQALKGLSEYYAEKGMELTPLGTKQGPWTPQGFSTK